MEFAEEGFGRKRIGDKGVVWNDLSNARIRFRRADTLEGLILLG